MRYVLWAVLAFGVAHSAQRTASNPLERNLRLNQEPDYRHEERNAFDECSGNDHGRLNASGGIRLTGNALGGGTSDPSDANPGTQHCEAGSKAGTNETESPAGGTSGLSCLLQEREHVQHV
jgi:hypothetical protein